MLEPRCDGGRTVDAVVPQGTRGSTDIRLCASEHRASGTPDDIATEHDPVPRARNHPHPYEDLLRLVLNSGTSKADRTGTGTRSVFGHQLRYDLAAGFPLITTKKVHLKSIIYELLWFLRGDSNIGWLNEHGVTIWDEWADPFGELGPIYGAQWRALADAVGEYIDQISAALDLLKSDPDSRGATSPAWNVGRFRRWRCHRAMRFFSSMSPTENCRASCISAAPTCSSACRSTSRRTHCSPT